MQVVHNGPVNVVLGPWMYTHVSATVRCAGAHGVAKAPRRVGVAEAKGWQGRTGAEARCRDQRDIFVIVIYWFIATY